MKQLIIKFLFLLLTLAFLQITNCKNNDDTDFLDVVTPPPPPPVAPPPVTPPPPSTTPIFDPIQNTPVGTIDPRSFWVNVKAHGPSGLAEIYVNSETFGEDCFIPTQTQNSQYVTCFVDILEGTLYTHELEIQYNVPPRLCEHLQFTPSWHWNRSNGVGPKKITLTLTGEENNTSVDCKTPDPADPDSEISCINHPELTDTSEPDGPTCIYNHSALDSKNPNCCFGNYTLYTRRDEERTKEERSWGGDVKACLGGMVQVAWENFNKSGYPRGLLYTIPKDDQERNLGMNKAHRIPSNIETTNVGFSTVANFYTKGTSSVQGIHEHTGYVSTTQLDVPYAVNPVDDLSGTPYNYKKESILHPGREAIYFDCEDDAFELKHRIEVYIREWNTLTEFVTYKTSGGQTYNPDVTQSENVCGYGGNFVDIHSLPCNDYRDFDDIARYLNGYDTSSPDESQKRESYFPNIPNNTE